MIGLDWLGRDSASGQFRPRCLWSPR
jgi:hypothetical protein